MKNKYLLLSALFGLLILLSFPHNAFGQIIYSQCVDTAIGSPVSAAVFPSICQPNTTGSTASNGCDPGPNDPAPPEDYTKITFRGKTLNVRTKVLIERAENYAQGLGVPTPFIITQGSYNPGGVSASAGTHDGGGAVDISTNSMDQTQIDNAVKALRMAGFASWYRTPDEGFPYHIHSMAIGDKDVTNAVALGQYTDYFAGKTGLAGHKKDTLTPASVGRPVPAWATQFGTCT